MDLLDRLLGHDAWTTRQLLLLCRDLTDGQLDQSFDIGYRTVRDTLRHTIHNVDAWGALIAGEAIPAGSVPGAPAPTIAELLERQERAAARLARVSREIARRGAWDERWLDPYDDPPSEKTYGGAIAHVITHSMHHRAQIIYMLRRLGLQDLPEGDVLSWEQTVVTPES